MIKKLAFLLVFFISVKSFSQQTVDFINIPGPIEYDGSEFFLSWSKPVSKTLYRQQYLLADETIATFTQLLDISFFNKEIEMEKAISHKVEQIQNRQKTDRFAKFNITESPDGTEYIVDYYTSETPEKGEPYMVYNIDRFKSYDDGSGKRFLILSYAKRVFGDLKTGSRALGRERDRLMINAIEYKIPEIKLLSQ